MRELIPPMESLPLWPIIAGPVFLLLFVGIIAWVYRRSGRSTYKQIEQIPLLDEEQTR